MRILKVFKAQNADEGKALVCLGDVLFFLCRKVMPARDWVDICAANNN